MVVNKVFVDCASQVGLSEEYELGQAFLFYRPHKSLRVSIQIRTTLNVPFEIVDDRGHLVARATITPATVALPQTVSFRPKASFQYRTPGSTDAPFRGRRYYLRVPEFEAGGEGAEIELFVEHIPG